MCVYVCVIKLSITVEVGRNPVSKHQVQPKYGNEQDDTGWDCRTRLARPNFQGNIDFPCSADHEQDWQPYRIDPYFCYMCDHTYYIQLRNLVLLS